MSRPQSNPFKSEQSLNIYDKSHTQSAVPNNIIYFFYIYFTYNISVFCFTILFRNNVVNRMINRYFLTETAYTIPFTTNNTDNHKYLVERPTH